MRDSAPVKHAGFNLTGAWGTATNVVEPRVASRNRSDEMKAISTLLITGACMALLAAPVMAGKGRYAEEPYYDYARVIKVREMGPV